MPNRCGFRLSKLHVTHHMPPSLNIIPIIVVVEVLSELYWNYLHKFLFFLFFFCFDLSWAPLKTHSCSYIHPCPFLSLPPFPWWSYQTTYNNFSSGAAHLICGFAQSDSFSKHLDQSNPDQLTIPIFEDLQNEQFLSNSNQDSFQAISISTQQSTISHYIVHGEIHAMDQFPYNARLTFEIGNISSNQNN